MALGTSFASRNQAGMVATFGVRRRRSFRSACGPAMIIYRIGKGYKPAT
jgi:hypothetical protein